MDTSLESSPAPGLRRSGAGLLHPRTLALIAAVALAATLVEASFGRMAGRNGVPSMPWLRAFWHTVPSWIVAAGLAPLAMALADRFPFRGGGLLAPLAVHVAGAAVFVALHLGITMAITPLFIGRPIAWWPAFLDMLRLYSLAEILIYASIVGAWNAVVFHRQALGRERDAAELARHLARARLEALRLQLQPHFLFNTLHTISALARRGDTETLVQTVEHLGDLLRAVLDENLRSVVPLEEELAFLRKYVAIQSLRFRDRLTVLWDIAPGCLAARVPPLILQPLVENALVHGIESRPGPGTIRLAARREQDTLRLVVEDSGAGLTTGGAPRRRGVGIASVIERLEHLHPGRAHLRGGASERGGARFEIEMPFVDSEGTA